MKRLFICLVLVTAATFSNILFAAEKPDRPDLEFRLGACSTKSPIGRGIIKATWLNKNTLFVEAAVGSTCGQIYSGDYELKEDALLLKYKSESDVLARCGCVQTLVYKLNGIPKKDYKITLQNVTVENSGEGK